ncbi:MAG TPA: glycosyltransferase family 9 protein [Isosphaeraceae bacterium]|jgi:ADP-heptose:LPS heptosyltransferase|nr:glycosyltransferase family 9 protein [Isosphaeraceae bacterium]
MDAARRPPVPPRRVLVLRALKLGDLLCAVPAFRALRAAWPGAEIVLAGLPWAREFVGRFGAYLDGFREFPGYPGLPECAPRIGAIPAFLAAIQDDRFDLAIQLHGSGPIVNEVVALFGARRSAGFHLPGSYRPDSGLFMPWPSRGLEVRRLLALVEHLGLPTRGEHLEFPVAPSDRAALHSIEGIGPLKEHPYVCVHPGASVPGRQWPADRFAAVARALADRGFRVVVTGTAAEAGLAGAIRREVPGALDLTGRTDLGSLGALLEGARLLACNDTGVSHVAAGLKLPSVVLSTGDNPSRWAPADRERHRVLCRDEGIEPAEVIDAASALLRAFPGPAVGRGEVVAPCTACAS